MLNKERVIKIKNKNFKCYWLEDLFSGLSPHWVILKNNVLIKPNAYELKKIRRI